jgi:hypothetical protein
MTAVTEEILNVILFGIGKMHRRSTSIAANFLKKFPFYQPNFWPFYRTHQYFLSLIHCCTEAVVDWSINKHGDDGRKSVRLFTSNRYAAEWVPEILYDIRLDNTLSI